ncbi:hypothetical protein D3C75_927580 [compost metagenome]
MGLCSNSCDRAADSAVDQHLLKGTAASDDEDDGRCRCEAFAGKPRDIFFLKAAGKAQRKEGKDSCDEQRDNLMTNKLGEGCKGIKTGRIKDIRNGTNQHKNNWQ